MSNKVKVFKLLFLLILVLFAVFIFILIIGENDLRRYRSQKSSTPSCFDLGKKYLPEVSEFFKRGADSNSKLTDFILRRGKGEKINKEEYQRLADEVTIEVDPSDLGITNGIACPPFAFVRRDLPSPAKSFVKRHELTHLLTDRADTRGEFLANMEAAKEYPWGFLQTTFVSIKNILTSSGCSLPCHVAILWKNFRIYFLP